jgi:hypothetical protein
LRCGDHGRKRFLSLLLTVEKLPTFSANFCFFFQQRYARRKKGNEQYNARSSSGSF